MQKVTLFLVLFVYSFILGSYLYKQGLQDGEYNYKYSHRMFLALESSYHYGYLDCKENLPESFDGEVDGKGGN